MPGCYWLILKKYRCLHWFCSPPSDALICPCITVHVLDTRWHCFLYNQFLFVDQLQLHIDTSMYILFRHGMYKFNWIKKKSKAKLYATYFPLSLWMIKWKQFHFMIKSVRTALSWMCFHGNVHTEFHFYSRWSLAGIWSGDSAVNISDHLLTRTPPNQAQDYNLPTYSTTIRFFHLHEQKTRSLTRCNHWHVCVCLCVCLCVCTSAFYCMVYAAPCALGCLGLSCLN